MRTVLETVNTAETRDRRTLRLLLERRETGLSQLLEDHASVVSGALRRGFGDALNEDVLEESLSLALYRVWRSVDSYDSAKGTLRGWFCSIAWNCVRDVLTRETNFHSHVGPMLGASSMVVDPVEPNGSAHEAAVKERIRKGLTSLAPLERGILEADLATKSGLAPADELAERFNTSKSVIYVTRSRARKRLATLLGDLVGTAPDPDDRRGGAA